MKDVILEDRNGSKSNQDDWKTIASRLLPGDKHPSDRTVSVVGQKVVYACELSASFGLFTLCHDEKSNAVLDIVLKRDDGWSSLDISRLVTFLKVRFHSNGFVSPIRVGGFLERMRAKSVLETSPVCLHARCVSMEDDQGTKLVWQPIPQGASRSLPSPESVSLHQPYSSVSNGGWRGAKDDTRFSKFAIFLLNTFGGYEALSQKPVLDIAGGAGGLAFELSVRHSIDCIIVDKQPVRFKAKQQRHVQFRQSCAEKLLLDNEKSPLAQNLLRRFQVANDLESLQLTQIQSWLQASLILDNSDKDDDYHHKSETDQSPIQELRSILRQKKCSILCGMHPDEATDEIIDIGLAMNIPWAVVPCCVFPNLFHSRMIHGKPVRSYEDYCAYIRSRRKDIQEAELPFRGRNKVFYWIPPPDS
jgi:hypothetical protein